MNRYITKLNAIYRKTLFCFLLTISWASGYSQSETLSYVQDHFNNYFRQALQEKLFVHTDKSFYIAGELMWFKIYDVDGSFNKPLDLSKVAYIELIGKDQKPVLQAKIALQEGTGSGSFFIPLSVNSGNYKLRAYTNWMKNFSPDFYFEKNIKIINALKKLGEKPQDTASAYMIHFFPEGGNLVNGIQSTVAFSVTASDGKGVNFRGMLTDQENNTVANFEPFRFGIGHFTFTPVAGKKYKAIIRIGDNNIIVGEFPDAYDQGYVMHVQDIGNGQLSITVSSNTSPLDQSVYLFAHTRQSIKIAERLNMSNGKAVFIIDKNKLGEGISNLTIFNSFRQPVCERLVFKRPVDLSVDVKADQESFQRRKKVTVNIEVEDMGHPVSANMSMSVYRVDSLESGEQENILSYLWLTSDLRGNIESPSYYMSTVGKEVETAIDNLMLTHGWRRFRWEDILQNKLASFEFVPEYEGHIIAGKITEKRSGQPVENILTYLSAPGIRYQLGCSLSNKKGQVQFDIKNFYGSNEIVAQMYNQKDSNYRLEIMSPFSEKFSSAPIPSFNISESLQEDLISHSIGTQVQNAYLTESLQKFDMPEMIDSTAFYGTPDKKYFLDDYTRFTTMEEVMREYIANVSLRKHQDKFYLKVLNDPYRLFFDDDPLVLMDGVPVFDVDRVISMDPLKVKKIEVVNQKYFLGPLVASGIVSYTTYKGDLEGFQLDPNAIVLEYEGLQMQREFYSPVYETDTQINSRMPDFRNLLFWSPDIKTDERGRKQVNFYTSDQQGKYIGVLQGISPDGKPCSQSFTFEVNK